MRFSVITLFPEIFASPLDHSILKRARERNLVSVDLVDLRRYARDRHRTTDDYPYGGGQGMVLKPEPLIEAIEDSRSRLEDPHVILLSPRGRVFDQEAALAVSRHQDVVLVCGRYEGVDERVVGYADELLSIGDYTLSGGEVPALAVIDGVARLVPGVLGNDRSAREDSFVDGLLEHPQYTRPAEYRGMKVPEVLLSGDHEEIRRWRRRMSVETTARLRPDLLAKAAAAPAGKVYVALLHHPVSDRLGRTVASSITNLDVHDIARTCRTYGAAGFYVVNPAKTLRKLDAAVAGVRRECGTAPRLVATSARSRPATNTITFGKMREMLIREPVPYMILLGAGWGLTDEVFDRSDFVLEPIAGRDDYNHLSVRAASAVMLDRILGRVMEGSVK